MAIVEERAESVQRGRSGLQHRVIETKRGSIVAREVPGVVRCSRRASGVAETVVNDTAPRLLGLCDGWSCCCGIGCWVYCCFTSLCGPITLDMHYSIEGPPQLRMRLLLLVSCPSELVWDMEVAAADVEAFIVDQAEKLSQVCCPGGYFGLLLSGYWMRVPRAPMCAF